VEPDLHIYVDEALAGNVLPERALAFKEAVGLDGVILTKMDADVKGGGAISISYVTGVPILYLGTGQNYEDLKEFKPKEIVNKILD
ncbi:MAG: signal recognition particle-docking protein FtsY, partial [Candidatus Diapherotrites archaeon]|nr:signal recognition particle-docking protein FtsY [Candidatus Diapherotrites archaeon]